MSSNVKVHPFEAYKRWVANNPERAAELETASRYLSYFVAGKVNKSPMFSELVYATSNLFTLYNDILIRKARGDSDALLDTAKDRLKLCLTILHYCEVFIEFSLRDKWGKRGKWTAAAVVQLIRCVSNLVLIYKYSEVPVQQPPIPILHRKALVDEVPKDLCEEGFKLKRSGRIVRRVEGAPPVALRNWKPPGNSQTLSPGDFDKRRLAETVYAIKPLVHLGSVALFGSETWKQWLTYLGCDLLSLHLYSSELDSLGYDQRVEINRRKLSLILFLLRSPMYQKYTATKIDSGLRSLSNVPLAKFICNPILQYISHWQDTYFYMWAN